MRHTYYRSEAGGRIVPCASVLEWGRWFEGSGNVPFDQGGRRVAWTDLPDGVHVSTVFLGMDHALIGDGPPVLFESMIFGGEHDQWQDRYHTVEAARAGHAEAVRLACGEPTPAAEK